MRVLRILGCLFGAAGLSAAVAMGQAWTRSGPDKVYALAVSPADGAVYAGTPQALYRSSDHGRSWALIQTFSADVTPMKISIDATNTMYLALGRGGGVFQSVDRGETLVPLPVPNPCWWDSPFFAIASSRPSTVYFSGCGVYRSDDSGATWTSIPLLVNIRSLAVDPFDHRRVLAGSQWASGNPGDPRTGLWISADGGGTWLPSAIPFLNEAIDVKFDATRPGRVLAVVDGTFHVARSEDDGETWVASSSGYAGNGPQALAIDPTNAQTMYLGSFPEYFSIGIPMPAPPITGVQVSRDGGATWSVVEGTPTSAYLLGIDPTGEFLYAATYGERGVSIFETRPARSTIVPPPHRSRPPHPVPRSPARAAQERGAAQER